MKFKLNRVIEEISYCRNIDTDAIWDTLDMQLSKLSEGEIVCVNEENGCDKKDEEEKINTYQT